jgi:hypothetical protein
VIQTYADKLLVDGYASEAAYAHARVLYDLARGWVDRVRQATADPKMRLIVAIPQPLPRPPVVPPDSGHLEGMRVTLDALLARSGADVDSCGDEELADRLRANLTKAAEALDTTSVDRLTACRAVVAALDLAHAVGQVLAMPLLLAVSKTAPPAEVTAASSPAALAVFRPGDPGFDPWCLTDPAEKPRIKLSTAAGGKLDALWKSDPQPAETLAIQAEIMRAVENGLADYTPQNRASSLGILSSKVPWPGVLYAREPLTIGSSAFGTGDRFVLAIGGSGDEFRRALVRMAADTQFDWTDSNPAPDLDGSLGDVLDTLGEVGLDILWPTRL